MISNAMTQALNTQLEKEFHSAYLYLGISSWCDANGFAGSANWFLIQYEEEQMHAMKVYRYLLDQGSQVRLKSIPEVSTSYANLLECFETSLTHERAMTAAFNELCDMAIGEKDHASYTFLQWFVNEQIEEEATVSDVIGKLKLVGDGQGVFMVDAQLAQRVPQPSAPGA